MGRKYYYVNGGIEGNTYQEKIVNSYLKSPRFKDRCESLRGAIKRAEEKKQREKEEQDNIKRSTPFNMFE
jgi:Arc/MetJ-type ribon-helix-helix transcriptional regulator